MTIRERIRTANHRDLAAKARLARPYVTQLGSGQRTPSVRAIVALADALEVSDEEIGASVREWANIHISDPIPAPMHKKPLGGESTAVAP